MNARGSRVAVALAAALALAGGVAYASIPGSDGTISGCYKQENGQLRVVDVAAADTCGPSELPIRWSVEGQPGKDGPPGPAGPQGPAGAQGPSGAETTYAYRSEQASNAGAVQVFCLPGEKVTGGGGFVSSPNHNIGLMQNHPISDRTGVIAFGTQAIGWQVASVGFAGHVAAFVICAS